MGRRCQQSQIVSLPLSWSCQVPGTPGRWRAKTRSPKPRPRILALKVKLGNSKREKPLPNIVSHACRTEPQRYQIDATRAFLKSNQIKSGVYLFILMIFEAYLRSSRDAVMTLDTIDTSPESTKFSVSLWASLSL
jgi:hypothetical protein